MIVGHTLLDHINTFWLDAGGFHGHHILYGSLPEWIATLTRIGDHLVPLSYPGESLLPLINAMGEGPDVPESGDP